MKAAQLSFFRDQIRSARAVALADAEGFQAILHALELIGQYLFGKVSGLGDYESELSKLASMSPLASELPGWWPQFHTDFQTLYDELRKARNDAMHQGAYARTITDHAVELAAILEDALMQDASMVSQFMVRNVVEAKPWHPVSYVRQQMLTQAFSYLPIRDEDVWKLIPEYAVARYLRNTSQAVRKQRLATPVSDAARESTLELVSAPIIRPDLLISGAVQQISNKPFLVIDEAHEDVLLGVLTASDVL